MSSYAVRANGREVFEQELRTVLYGLYDPAILRASPLLDIFSLRQQRDPVGALRRSLTDAIEAMQPNEQMHSLSKSWRVYQILRWRYIEQRIQRDVADHLGLSIRQMQRGEKAAREQLADHLWVTFHLIQPVTRANPQEQTPQAAGAQSKLNDLASLKTSVPIQEIEIGEMLREALATLQPVLHAAGVSIRFEPGNEPIRLVLRMPILRQVVLNLINIGADLAAGGEISFVIRHNSTQVDLHITAARTGQDLPQLPAGEIESLEMAARLTELCDGKLTITSAPHGYHAHILLPKENAIPVLVIEDHADTLQLYQRYLEGSRYRMISTSDPRQGISLLTKFRPQAVILDVMMPEIDGWTLLGLMRVHPSMQGIPIIVCSIIPQERLALSLGASEFLRKPANRTDLLAVIDRVISRHP